MKYRFNRIWRQFRAGDPVPETYESGVLRTMADAHIIEAVPEPVEIDEAIAELVEVLTPPVPQDLKENKAIKTGSRKVRAKA